MAKITTHIMANEVNFLQVEDLHVHYTTDDGTARAVNGVSLSLRKGRTLGLVGETGAGKTTTALSIMNLVPKPQGRVISGRITVAGEDILSKREKEMTPLRGALMSMIFQDPMTALNPVIRVGDQIAEVLELHEGLKGAKAKAKAREMLELVGIDGGRASEYPHQFSGGMKQRVGIAMALACRPQLLIADEPTTALDVTIQAQVLKLMVELRDKLGMSLLLITHDLGIVADLCDDVAIMYAGRIIEYGSIEDIFRRHKHPYTRGLFGSLPDIADRKAKLKPIKGLMPDPFSPKRGCAFRDRCDWALPACATEEPALARFGLTHMAACHLYLHKEDRHA